MKPIRVDFEKNEVIMTRKFAAAAADPRTREYKMLQDVLNTYDGICVKRHTIKKNPNKESYKGLTYDFMRDYIASHESQPETVLAEFDEMILISKCHSSGHRYPTIKKWFLDRYENIEFFGTDEKQAQKIRERKSKEAATKMALVAIAAKATPAA